MDQIELQMLNALELFHYGNRFRRKLFVLDIERGVSLANLINDLRVLQAAYIRVIIFCEDHPQLSAELESWNIRGARFKYFPHHLEKGISITRYKEIEKALKSELVPVMAWTSPSLAPAERQQFTGSSALSALRAVDTAEHFGAVKVFFLSLIKGLEVDGVLQSHPTTEEIEKFLKEDLNINIPKAQLQFLHEQNDNREMELVLLEGISGTLFQEIFTHRGKGTLFTSDYPNIVRRGMLSDVTDISLLLKPYIADGSLLPTTEDKIAQEIENYFVYTVNGVIVAATRLADYGECAELTKFSTLPRFQGRGRARQLALAMIEEAKRLGKKYVFALSIEPKMWQFFLSLGFQETTRENLPDTWKNAYDFSRPSKAFRLDCRS